MDVFEELGGSVLESTQALSAAEPGLSSLAVDASACVKKRPVYVIHSQWSEPLRLMLLDTASCSVEAIGGELHRWIRLDSTGTAGTVEP